MDRESEVEAVAVTPPAAADPAPAGLTASLEPAPAVAPPIGPRLPRAPVAEAAFVYALGRIEPQFPSLSIEKELDQAVAAGDGDYGRELTERERLSSALRERDNRYLARSLCWVLAIEGLDTYILVPRDPADLDLLVDAYRAEPREDDLDAVIGTLGPIAPPDMCGGIGLPIVVFDQLYSFDRRTLIESIPRPDSVPERRAARFRRVADELFGQLLQVADNAGAIDEHRAINYLMVRYPRIYGVTAELFERNLVFTGVDVTPSALGGARSIVEVVFSYRHRETDVVERQFARVDVTEEFPFLVTKMGPYFDR